MERERVQGHNKALGGTLNSGSFLPLMAMYKG